MAANRKKFEGLFVNPFSDAFLPIWELWKEYKLLTFRFKYATPMSEQAAVNELVELSDGDEATAEKVIRQSMSNQWRGLFKLKTLKAIEGGKSKQGYSSKETRESVNDALNERFAKRGPAGDYSGA